jgi:hypothetical protein
MFRQIWIKEKLGLQELYLRTHDKSWIELWVYTVQVEPIRTVEMTSYTNFIFAQI